MNGDDPICDECDYPEDDCTCEPEQFIVYIENTIEGTAIYGPYLPGDTVTINVGGVTGPNGERFNKWALVLGNVSFANQYAYIITFIMPESDVMLSIIWGPQDIGDGVIVSFFRNYSSEDIVANIVILEDSTSIGADFPPNPTRVGFTFIGWNTEQDGSGIAVTSERSVGTIDFSVYAQWSENPPPPPPPPKPSTKPPTPPAQDVNDQVEDNIIQGANNQRPNNNSQSGRSSASSPELTELPPPALPGHILYSTIMDALESVRPLIRISESDPTIISEESLQIIRESGRILEIELPNGLVIRIDPNSITNNTTALNINIDVEITGQETIVNDVQFPANSIVIAPSAHGAFGLSISFDISARQLADAGLDASDTRLFYISSEGVVTEAGMIRQNDDGSVTITINHASLYLLSEEEPVIVAPIIDTPIDDAPVLEDPIVEAPVRETAASEPATSRPAVAPPPPAPDEGGFNLWIIIIAQSVVIVGCLAFTILRGKGKKKNDVAAEPVEAPQEA